MNKKVYIRTFGCQMNVHDSEKMAGILLKEGYSLADAPNNADIVIFNTCSIRQKAEQKFKSELGKARLIKENNPGLRVAVAGCIAQQKGTALFKNNSCVDYVLGPQNIHQLTDMLESRANAVLIDENPDVENIDLPALRGDNVRAWVSIMYGCDNFCSYCIVPHTRGMEKSRPSVNILEEVSMLASKGFKEITLLGQNVNSYRSDTGFPGLLKKIHRIGGLKRIRFVTSHPKDLSEDLAKCIKELPMVCEHMHLPLQSGSDRILNLMNRKYTYDMYLRKTEMLRKEIPGIAITTDIIAGFPSESESDHRQTVRALGEIGFDGIFAFNFSPRPGTEAALMDDSVSDEIKSERLAEILAIQDDITLGKNKALEGTIQEVLVEGVDKNRSSILMGRTRTNKIVSFWGRPKLRGVIVSVSIVKAKKHSLEGKLPDTGK